MGKKYFSIVNAIFTGSYSMFLTNVTKSDQFLISEGFLEYWRQLKISWNIAELSPEKLEFSEIFVTDVAELDSSRPLTHTHTHTHRERENIKAQHIAALNWVRATKHNSPKNTQCITQILLIISID